MAPQSSRKAPAKSPYRAFYWILGVIALAGIGALALSVLRARGGGAATMEPVKMDSTNVREVFARAKAEKVGPDSAPAKLVVFSDYQCPGCGQWASQVQPRLVEEFVKAGKLQIAFYDFPLLQIHKYSFLASRAARCAGEQDRFWEMHDYIFGRQSDWSFASSAPVKTFESYARTVGVDGPRFDTCLESDRFADVVSANRLLGTQLGINGTPTVILNEMKLGDPGLRDFDGLRRAVQRAAGMSAAAPAQPAPTPAAPQAR